ncbi:winged helix-turn-helix transcriptional regulator [candidate division WWE3 bacterium]|nr:winged helix-turn-helix transcriptional regulator [candidate division WWE3 bacterium]
MFDILKVSKAFSDKNRLKILTMLSGGSKNVGEVADNLKVEENLASHHLRVLASLGFLKSTKKGREVHYSINRDRVDSVLEDIKKEILNPA